METTILVVVLVAQVIIIALCNRTSSRLKKIEDESQRHNNIQKVILEQVDQLTQKIGI